LFINKSKIQFESKSQQFDANISLTDCCLSINQRYNLKANHNNQHSII